MGDEDIKEVEALLKSQKEELDASYKEEEQEPKDQKVYKQRLLDIYREHLRNILDKVEFSGFCMYY